MSRTLRRGGGRGIPALNRKENDKKDEAIKINKMNMKEEKLGEEKWH